MVKQGGAVFAMRQIFWPTGNIAKYIFGISFVFTLMFSLNCALAQQAPAGQGAGKVQDVPSNSAPTQPAQAETLPAQGSVLPTSASDPTRDICGNQAGTVYTELMRCRQLESQSGPYITYKSPFESTLTEMALALSLAFVLIYCAMQIFTTKMDETAIRYFVIIAVIGSAVFILTAGYDDKQAAPLYGLFGTLIGYIFGKSQSEVMASRAPLEGATQKGKSEGNAVNSDTVSETTAQSLEQVENDFPEDRTLASPDKR
jgi:hypothetical protein